MIRTRTLKARIVEDLTFKIRAGAIGLVETLQRRPSRRRKTKGLSEIVAIDRKGAHAAPRNKSTSGAKFVIVG